MMAFLPAIRTALRNEILRTLRKDITFLCSPNDRNRPIVEGAIIQQKVRAQQGREFERQQQMIDIPGLLVCEPFRTPIPPNEGTNERDVWYYHFLVQLIDADLWSNTDRRESWDRWQEQILEAFMFNPLDVIAIPRGQVKCSTVSIIQDIDESRWIRDGKFISGIEIEVQVLQPRGLIVAPD